MQRIIFIFCISLLLYSCSSQKVVFQKTGEGYEINRQKVIVEKDLRRLYDEKKFNELYDLLFILTKIPEINDYYLHFLLIEAAYYTNRINSISQFYKNSPYRVFYEAIIEFQKGNYTQTIKYLKTIKENNPVLFYFMGASYLFLKDYPMAISYLTLSEKWQHPWVFFALSSYYEIKKNYPQALFYIEKALDYTYDFETEIITEIFIRKTDILMEKYSYEEAINAALQLFQKNKEKTLTFIDPGDIYLIIGKKKEALQFWNKVLNDPTLSESTRELVRSKREALLKIEGL